MIHRIVSRVASADGASGFWTQRLGDGVATERDGDRLRFADPEGLGHELVVRGDGDELLRAEHPEIPAEHALGGFDSVRAYAADPERSRALLEDVLGATAAGEAEAARRTPRRDDRLRPSTGAGRAGRGRRPPWPGGRRWPSTPRWHERVAGAGVRVTPIIDRHYFLDLLPRAQRRAVRDRRRRPRVQVRRPGRNSARGSSCPRSWRTMRRIEARLTPATCAWMARGPAVRCLWTWPPPPNPVADVCRAAKRASRALAQLDTGTKDRALHAIADAIDARADEILEANARDMEAASDELSAAFKDKMRLDAARVAAMAEGVRAIVALQDPVGEVIEGFRLPNGLDVRKVRVPLGVVAVVYEARPT